MPGSGSNYTTTYNTSHNYSQQGGKSQSYSKNNNADSGSQSAYHKPRGVLDAVSEIQQYHALEKLAETELPAEYFTYKQQLDFFNIGLKSAFIEGLMFLAIVPFAEAIYPSFRQFFFNEGLSTNELITIYAASYSPVLVMTIFLAAMSRYYSGVLTRKAITALISGRSMAFIFKGIIVFILWTILSALTAGNPEFVYQAADYSLAMIQSFVPHMELTPQHVYYYFYKSALPAMNETAIHVLITMVFLSVLPFMTLYWRGFAKDREAKLAKEAYEEY
ncbi:MAG: hypothetical protein U9Q62_07960 [Campylobacterota bacterium]|nr:hypothetical protein [Campylobacterota bacterium]